MDGEEGTAGTESSEELSRDPSVRVNKSKEESVQMEA